MTPEEYIKQLKGVQDSLDEIKEDFNRAINSMKLVVASDDEEMIKESIQALLSGYESMVVTTDRLRSSIIKKTLVQK